jgi:hypothetical protein
MEEPVTISADETNFSKAEAMVPERPGLGLLGWIHARDDQPLQVVFDKAPPELRDEGNRNQFALESKDVELRGLPRTMGDQRGFRSDGCLSRKMRRLLRDRTPTPQGSLATIKQTARKARAAARARSQCEVGKVSL